MNTAGARSASAGLHRRVVIVALCTGVLAGCTIRAESSPRDIPIERRDEVLSEPVTGGSAATGNERIYLVAPTGAGQPLRTVSRDTGASPDALIEQLLAGPNAAERAAGLTTALPAELGLASPVRLDAGVVTVDLDEELELSGSELPSAVAQIVYTASQVPGADRVLIRVDGDARPWPDGAGTEQNTPLSTYDFPGFAESLAPAFPAVPPQPVDVPVPVPSTPATGPLS